MEDPELLEDVVSGHKKTKAVLAGNQGRNTSYQKAHSDATSHLKGSRI
jgi:hypothetical protein